MASIKRIKKLKGMIHEYDLEAPDEFYLLNNKELAALYNGAGPDWLGSWSREQLTDFLKLFEAAFLVHDYEFTCSNNSEDGFRAANKRMWR